MGRNASGAELRKQTAHYTRKGKFSCALWVFLLNKEAKINNSDTENKNRYQICLLIAIVYS